MLFSADPCNFHQCWMLTNCWFDFSLFLKFAFAVQQHTWLRMKGNLTYIRQLTTGVQYVTKSKDLKWIGLLIADTDQIRRSILSPILILQILLSLSFFSGHDLHVLAFHWYSRWIWQFLFPSDSFCWGPCCTLISHLCTGSKICTDQWGSLR